MNATHQEPWENGAPIAYTEFMGGGMRPVYENAEGRQFVIDDRGRQIFGVWFIPEEVDRPVIVDDRDF